MLAVIYNAAGKVVAEAEAVLDDDGRHPAEVVLDGHRGAGPIRGRLLGVSSALARYQAVEHDTPEPEAEADGGGGPPKRRGRKAAPATGEAA